MVATRRSVGQELSVDGGESSVVPPPEVSADLNITTTQRLTRSRYKESSQSVVLSESQAEEPGAVAAKLQLVDLSEHPNLALQRTTRSRRKHEPHSDGDVSEAESNCSSVSSLQMPIVTRTTRSRQIKITCPSDSITKSKTKKSMSRTEPITESQEEGEVSEAESCCSSVSGIQMTCTTRTTRSRKNLVKILPTLTSEPQIEDISDAESWCSGISVGPSTRRVTRSTTVKFQPETTNQSPENDIDLCAEEEPLKRSSENGTEYQPLVVSDTDSKVKGDSATEETSFAPTAVSRNLRNRLPLPRRNEFQPEHEVEEKTQKDTHLRSSQATEKRKRNRITLLNKNSKNTYLAIIDSEEELDQALEMEKVGNDSESQLVNVDMSQLEQNNKRSLSSQKHSPLKQRQTVSVHQQVDVRESVTSSCQQAAKLMGKKQSTERSQQNKDLDFTSIDNDMDDDDCKIVEADTDIDQGEVVLQSKAKVNACTKETCDKSKVISLTPSHLESDTSEEEDDLSNMKASNLKPLLLHSSEDELPHVDGLFVIDKAPGLHSSKQYYLEEKDEGVNAEYEEQPPVLDEDDFVDEAEDLTLLKSSKAGFGLSTSIDPGLNVKDIGGLYISFDVDKQKPDSSTLKKIKEKKNNEELLQKSLLSPDFEKRECVPPYSESVRQLKKKRKEERAKTTGDGWFGMKAPEMTEELKNDLKALKMRSAMDPKRFYKKNDRDGFPKYFQVGTVVDNPIDFYHSRIPKKQRKRTIVEELLADSEFRRYNKKKYQQIMTEKASLAAGKKNRKKKKFCT